MRKCFACESRVVLDFGTEIPLFTTVALARLLYASDGDRTRTHACSHTNTHTLTNTNAKTLANVYIRNLHFFCKSLPFNTTDTSRSHCNPEIESAIRSFVIQPISISPAAVRTHLLGTWHVASSAVVFVCIVRSDDNLHLAYLCQDLNINTNCGS